MKRIVGFAVVLFLCACSANLHAASSPISPGSWIINGNVGLNASLSGGGTTLYIEPSALTFIQEHLAIGGQFILTTGGGFTTFGIIPEAAYVFGDRNSKGYPYARAGLGLMSTAGNTSFVINLGGGYMSMLTRDVFLNFSGMFNIATGTGSNSVLSLNMGVGAFIW